MKDDKSNFVKGDLIEVADSFEDEGLIGTIIHVDNDFAWVKWNEESYYGDTDEVVSLNNITHASIKLSIPFDVVQALAAGEYYLEDQKILTEAALDWLENEFKKE